MTGDWLMPLGVLLDVLLGETRHWHPLVGFGRLANHLESRLNRQQPLFFNRLLGILALMLVVIPWVYLAYLLAGVPLYGNLFSVLILYFTLGLHSLAAHTRPIATALSAHDVPTAREQLARVVSRDTTTLDETGIAKAAVETVLENGNDAVFAALFWFALAGAPGALAYRLVNTLDAMWGYKTPRFYAFGWAAARLDDALNYLPARLTALTYALFGKTRQALSCWRKQAPQWDSPNAGPVMAAGAGALGVQLGGVAVYHGQEEIRPQLGAGPAPVAADIDRALTLIHKGVWLWLVLHAAMGLWHA
ncbi:adenosylcobinamide-phosphate synthase CbiB [Sulfuriferula sp. AH1]|uniref:adenosylcobinamide-phosphate synthase CbiB n=1 Tax=Sulfuriferula sp. AH1 TaxID=1985873 RepID=UPI000B3B737E|nr:adenosylcobinamide-phosphate synthase CbiB [Sulfuriferula sp. AH1]